MGAAAAPAGSGPILRSSEASGRQVAGNAAVRLGVRAVWPTAPRAVGVARWGSSPGRAVSGSRCHSLRSGAGGRCRSRRQAYRIGEASARRSGIAERSFGSAIRTRTPGTSVAPGRRLDGRSLRAGGKAVRSDRRSRCPVWEGWESAHALPPPGYRSPSGSASTLSTPAAPLEYLGIRASAPRHRSGPSASEHAALHASGNPLPARAPPRTGTLPTAPRLQLVHPAPKLNGFAPRRIARPSAPVHGESTKISFGVPLRTVTPRSAGEVNRLEVLDVPATLLAELLHPDSDRSERPSSNTPPNPDTPPPGRPRTPLPHFRFLPGMGSRRRVLRDQLPRHVVLNPIPTPPPAPGSRRHPPPGIQRNHLRGSSNSRKPPPPHFSAPTADRKRPSRVESAATNRQLLTECRVNHRPRPLPVVTVPRVPRNQEGRSSSPGQGAAPSPRAEPPPSATDSGQVRKQLPAPKPSRGVLGHPSTCGARPGKLPADPTLPSPPSAKLASVLPVTRFLNTAPTFAHLGDTYGSAPDSARAGNTPRTGKPTVAPTIPLDPPSHRPLGDSAVSPSPVTPALDHHGVSGLHQTRNHLVRTSACSVTSPSSSARRRKNRFTSSRFSPEPAQRI